MKRIIAFTLVLTLQLLLVSGVAAQGTNPQNPPQPNPTQCNDGKDNDGDGKTDVLDPECKNNAKAVCETGEEKAPCPSNTGTGSGAGAGGSGTKGKPIPITINNPLKVDTIQEAIKLFMTAALRIILPLLVLFFIWAGLQFVFARGNPDKLKVAKKTFRYTIVGTLLILGAWVITNAIIGTVNSITS